MEYRFNEARDAVDRYAGNIAYFQAKYTGKDGDRSAYYWAVTSEPRHCKTIAMNNRISEEEEIVRISITPRERFVDWLLDGEKTLDVDGVKIPGTEVSRILITEACQNRLTPGYRPDYVNAIHGSLDAFRIKLQERDADLLKIVKNMYLAMQPDRDVVRKEADVTVLPMPKELCASWWNYKEEEKEDSEEMERE